MPKPGESKVKVEPKGTSQTPPKLEGQKPKVEAPKAPLLATPVAKPEVPASETPKPEATKTEASKEDFPKTVTLAYLYSELLTHRQIIQQHAQQIAALQEASTRKRKPMTSNGKVQIKYKPTGKVYKSKNATYQTMLKEGSLKELIDQGIFGDNPQKNSFGWYALVRAWPDRFEEIKQEQPKAQQS